MLDCALECSKWGITCFFGVGGQQFQKIDKSLKNNRLKHVTKPFHGAGLGSFLVQADDDRAPAEIPGVAGSCAALTELQQQVALNLQAVQPKPVCSAWKVHPKNLEQAPSGLFDVAGTAVALALCLCCCVFGMFCHLSGKAFIWGWFFFIFFLWWRRS